MKKFLKIFGISVAVIFGVVLIAIGFYALIGGFNEKIVDLTKIYFETEDQTEKRLIIEDDIDITINYLPLDATETTLKAIVTGEGVTVPETITVGKEFTIAVKKDANGRNIGGNAQIEFVSNSKSSASNLIKPCKLQVVVDVPVEDNDLMFRTSLDYVSSVDASRQYIIAKNTPRTSFDLYANKNNIFDINQWSDDENKNLYFYYYNTDGNIVDIDISNVVNNENVGDAVDCYYNNLEKRYEFNFYPGNVDTGTFKIYAKTHRSYFIQKEFIDSGFDDFEDIYLSQKISDLRANSNFLSLLSSYSDFLEKYYMDYFTVENPDALQFFKSLSLNGKVELLANEENVLENVKKSLNYVFVSTSIEFYISDVKVTEFRLDNTTKQMSLINLNDDGSKNRTELFTVFDGNDGYKGLMSYFNISLQAESLDNNISEIQQAAKLSLLENMKIDVLLYDKSGLSNITKAISLQENKNPNINNEGQYNYSNSITNYISENNDAVKEGKNSIFGENSQYLTVDKKEMQNGTVYWEFNKLVPSKIKLDASENKIFQIYLMFTLEVNDEDGRKVFFDFVEVDVNDTSDTANNGVEKNNNLNFKNTMYIYDLSSSTGTSLEQEMLCLNKQSITEPNNVYANTVFDNYKLFAFVGTGDNSGTTITIDDDISVLTNSILDKKLYYPMLNVDAININNVLSSRLCKFTNLDGNVLTYKDGTISYAGIYDKDSNENKNIIYAFELNWDEIKALSASNNNVVIFGMYVLTDADNNPIDREGCRLFNDLNQLVDKEYKVIGAGTNNISFGEDVKTPEVEIAQNQIVNYIGLNVVDFDNKIQTKSVLENLYYYTKFLNETKVGDTTYTKDSYLLRNSTNNQFSLLKLIAGNNYSDILTVLPFSYEELKILYPTNAGTEPEPTPALIVANDAQLQLHKKLTNQLLAYIEVVEDPNYPLAFITNDSYADLIVEKYDKNNLNTQTGSELAMFYQTLISVKTKSPTQSNSRPNIKLADSFVSHSIYSPTNAVITLDISEVKVNDFKNIFNGANPLESNFTVTTGVNNKLAWDNTLFDGKLPKIFNSLDNLITTDPSNFDTNLLNGIIVNGTNVMFDSNTIDSSVIDISLLNIEYIETCFLKYLFNFDGLDDFETKGYSDLKYYVSNLLSNTETSVADLYNLSNVNMTTNPSISSANAIYVNITNITLKNLNIEKTDFSNYFKEDKYNKDTNIVTLENGDLPIKEEYTDKVEVTVDNNTNEVLSIVLLQTVSTNEYSNYFSEVVNNNGIVIVKLNEDGTLPIQPTTNNFIVTFQLIWEFKNELQPISIITKEYIVDVSFEKPTFVLNGDKNQTIKLNATTTDDKDKGSNEIYKIRYIDLSTLIIATDKNNNSLKGAVNYKIDNATYGYFRNSSQDKVDSVSGAESYNSNNGVPVKLYVYDCFSVRTLTVTCRLMGCEDITITVTIEANLIEEKEQLGSKRFVSHINSDLIEYIDGANSEIKIDTDKDGTLETTLTNIYKFNYGGAGITYNISDLLKIKKGNEYKTLTYKINIDGTVKEGNEISFTGNTFKEMTLIITIDVNQLQGIVVSSTDDYLSSLKYEVKVYPLFRLSQSVDLEASTDKQYYSYNTGTWLENGYDLYGNIIGLEYLNQINDVNNNAFMEFTYEKINDYSSVSDLLTIQKSDNTSYENNNFNIKYWLNDKNFAINNQFYSKGDDGAYNRNDLGVAVYGNNIVSVDNQGKLHSSPVDVSYILPVDFKLDNKVYTVFVPIAGYTVNTKDASSNWVKADYDYVNNKYVLQSIQLIAGNTYSLSDYVKLSYAMDIFKTMSSTDLSFIPGFTVGNFAVDGINIAKIESIDNNKDYGLELHIYNLIGAVTANINLNEKIYLTKYVYANGDVGVEFGIKIPLNIVIVPSVQINLGTNASSKAQYIIINDELLQTAVDLNTGVLTPLEITIGSGIDLFKSYITLLNFDQAFEYSAKSTQLVEATKTGSNCKITFEFYSDVVDVENKKFVNNTNPPYDLNINATLKIERTDNNDSVTLYFKIIIPATNIAS